MKASSICVKFLLLISAGIFLSCENEPLEGEFSDYIPPPPIGQFQVEMDGELWIADEVYGARVNQMGINMMSISASLGSESFNFMMDGSQTGTYNLATEGNAGMYMPQGGAAGSSYTDNEIIVNVTSINENNFSLNGTFEGLLIKDQDTIVLTNGIFESVPYQYQQDENPPNGSDEYYGSAIIDGELYTATTVSAGSTSGQEGFAIALAESPQTVLTLWLPPNIEANTSYPIASQMELFPKASFMSFAGPTAYVSVQESGAISITDLNSVSVKGTFQFEMMEMDIEDNNITVTEGEFYAPIQ